MWWMMISAAFPLRVSYLLIQTQSGFRFGLVLVSSIRFVPEGHRSDSRLRDVQGRYPLASQSTHERVFVGTRLLLCGLATCLRDLRRLKR